MDSHTDAQWWQSLLVFVSLVSAFPDDKAHSVHAFLDAASRGDTLDCPQTLFHTIPWQEDTHIDDSHLISEASCYRSAARRSLVISNGVGDVAKYLSEAASSIFKTDDSNVPWSGSGTPFDGAPTASYVGSHC